MRSRPLAVLTSTLVASALLAGGSLPGPAGAIGAPTTSLVSRAAGQAGADANGASTGPTVSADGRFVAFVSAATNLHPDDADATPDVFVRDVRTGAVELVSRAAGAAGAKANGASVTARISADGGRVVFSTTATNLDGADADATVDVYVRDRVAGTTTLVSRASGAAGVKGNGASLLPSISADGGVVAFTSLSSNLDGADADVTADVYVRNLAAATTTLVSRATGAAGVKGNNFSTEGSISANGKRVVFATAATNLDGTDIDVFADVYVRDLADNTTTLASRASGAAGVKGNNNTSGAELSADGTLVVFESSSTNLDAADIDVLSDVFVRDLSSATTTLVSRASGAAGAKSGGLSTNATISGDGKRVAFASAGVNLDPGDLDVTLDVFVRDLSASTTVLVSRAAGATGVKANANSAVGGRISLNADGRYVLFDSLASNLDPADVDALNDVFVRVLDLPEILSFDPPTLRRGFSRVVRIVGSGFTAVPDVSFGPGVVVDAVQTKSTSVLEMVVTVASDAPLGARTVIVTNPAGDAVSAGTFSVVDVAGYWLVARDGGIFSLDAAFSGSTGNLRLNQPIVGMAADPDGKGYWFVAADGGVFSFDATFHGSMGATRLNQPIVGMAAAPDGKGYWLVARDGGIFAFGSAAFSGSTGNLRLNQPIVGMAADPDGKGYWFVAADGGVFSFDATFEGSMGATRLNRPIVGMAADPDGKGYWLVASDGGIFSFAAVFSGSTGNLALNQPIVGMAADPDGKGYWFVAADGGVFSFDAVFHGSMGATRLNQPIVGMAPA